MIAPNDFLCIIFERKNFFASYLREKWVRVEQPVTSRHSKAVTSILFYADAFLYFL